MFQTRYDEDLTACLFEYEDAQALCEDLERIFFAPVMSWKNEAAVMDARMVTKYVDNIPVALRIKTFSAAVRAGMVL